MSTVISYLDEYCERAGDPALFAEPLNAATNLFFILAAFLAGRALLKLDKNPSDRRIDLWLLVAAMFCIGIGSGLWHMIPTSATVLMDVIPITFFIHVYLIATLSRVLQLSRKGVVFWWCMYFAMSICAQMVLDPNLFHGTILYIPTYCTLIALTIAVTPKNRQVAGVFIKMLACWTAALIFRTIDLDVCEKFHWGTHFLWHTLNAYMLYRLAMVYIARPKGTIH